MIDLYKDLILDHGLNPRNKYILDVFTHSGQGINHFCGDQFILYFNIVDGFFKDISFNGQGCSISIASASILTVFLKGGSVDDAEKLFYYFQNLIRGKIEKNDKLYDLNVLSNVNRFPSRVKCAMLIWHTLKDILNFKV